MKYDDLRVKNNVFFDQANRTFQNRPGPRGSIHRIKIVLWIALIPPENACSPIFLMKILFEKKSKIQPHVPLKGRAAGDYLQPPLALVRRRPCAHARAAPPVRWRVWEGRGALESEVCVSVCGRGGAWISLGPLWTDFGLNLK